MVITGGGCFTSPAGLATDVSDQMSGRELRAVADELRGAGVRVAGALSAAPMTNGRSNLTFRIDDGESAWVLRMPPRVGRTPSAHDVVREYTVIAALSETEVPVPGPVLVVKDESVLGSPFTVTEFVRGSSMQTHDDLAGLDDDVLDDVLRGLVTTLAALHRLDHRQIGLEEFGRADGYVRRQVRRWTAQWSIVGDNRLGKVAAEVSGRLESRVTDRGQAGLVHGDYRIDNTLIDLTGAVPSLAAVVDWELSTIGDPVADVATMCAYRHPALNLIHGRPSAWTSPRLPDADALATAYERAGGVVLEQWDLHLGLAYFKIGVIAAGIEHRYRASAGKDPGHASAGAAVETYLELAFDRLRGIA